MAQARSRVRTGSRGDLERSAAGAAVCAAQTAGSAITGSGVFATNGSRGGAGTAALRGLGGSGVFSGNATPGTGSSSKRTRTSLGGAESRPAKSGPAAVCGVRGKDRRERAGAGGGGGGG